MIKVHPDFAAIETVQRTQDDLAILPRLDRSGMKSLHLDVPMKTARRLRAGTTGSSTQAIAIIARWVLETLEVDALQLVADPGAASGYRVESGQGQPLIDARMREAVSTSGVGTEPMLASLPPNTHRMLRDRCSGSLRRVVMTALEFGIERLDAEMLTLRLCDYTEGQSRLGRVLIGAGGGKDLDGNVLEEREQWIKKARTTLRWLGFDAALLDDIAVIENNDLLLQLGDTPTDKKLPQVIQHIPSRALCVHPAEWFALEGEWCVEMPQLLLEKRGKFCDQCGYGQSEGNLVQFQVQAQERQVVMLCSHCSGMFSP